MQVRIWMIAAVMAAAAGMPVASAADREDVNGVTVLRGGGNLQNTGPGVPPTSIGPDVTSGSRGGSGIDNTGAVNAVRTGSANAGGEIANPPPGAGR